MNRFIGLFCSGIFFIIISCNTHKLLIVENPKINLNENPYNYDNKIYTPQREYIFDYVIIKNSDSLKYKIINDSVFEYVSKNVLSDNIIEYLSIKTLKDKGPIYIDHPEYNQTEIILSHLNSKKVPLKKELTGSIENIKNVWLHPFRINAFQILQFSPFPYIKPNEKKPYYWSLAIGEHWDELINIDWKGNLNLNCKYENENEEYLKIPFGTFKVTKTYSSCKSKLGTNYLTSYYNEDLGFIKLEYNLINNEKIVMTLKNMTE